MTDPKMPEPAAWCDDPFLAGGHGNCASNSTRAYWARGDRVHKKMAERLRHPLITTEAAQAYAEALAAARVAQERERWAVLTDDMLRYAMGPGGPMEAEKLRRFWRLAIEARDTQPPETDESHCVLAGQVKRNVMPPEQQVERLDSLLRAMQADACTYLTPGSGCGADWFVSRMLWHLDGPEQRVAQGIDP